MSELGQDALNNNIHDQKRLIERIPRLNPSEIIDLHNDEVGVKLKLPGEHSGEISLRYEQYEYDLGNRYATVISYIEAPGKDNIKDPLQGVATAFTMTATINRAAESIGKPILHKVLANKKSKPLFERLRSWGIYQYCDSLGEPSKEPVTSESGMFNGEYVYYSCIYPSGNLDQMFNKFVIKEAAKKLVEKYPTPLRLMRHRL